MIARMAGEKTSYWDYIKVEQLLALQAGIAPDESGLSDDEVRFIVIHQVDELWFKIFPITLGEGKRLFGEGTTATAFTLESSTVSPSGVIVANYRRAGDVQTGSFGA